MSEKKFASHADVEEKTVSFDRLSDHAYAYTAQGDPNTGIVVGDDAVMVIDTQATPVMAQDVIRRIREVTDKPIRYVTLSHYHAVRVLGASGYRPEHIIASRDTYDLILERGSLGTDLAESTGHDDGGADAARGAIAESLWHGRGGDDQHGHVDRVRHILERGVHGKSHQRFGFGVDEVHRTAILALEDVAGHTVAHG